MDRAHTCCFTGHRPSKLPWGYDERDPRCLALKRSMCREIELLHRRGYTHFITGMALGCDLYFAQAVLETKEIYPTITLEAAIPFPGQADRWSPEHQARYRALLEQCSIESVVQNHYDRGCMLRRDRYMVDRSSVVLSVYDDTPGGTRYTLDYAAKNLRSILLLDLNHPDAPAVRLDPETSI